MAIWDSKDLNTSGRRMLAEIVGWSKECPECGASVPIPKPQRKKSAHAQRTAELKDAVVEAARKWSGEDDFDGGKTMRDLMNAVDALEEHLQEVGNEG